MLDWLAILPPVAFWLVVALLFAGLVALVFGMVALASRHYLFATDDVVQDVMVEHVGAERPQDYRDLVRLMQTLQALEVREPGQQAIRDALLTKLTTVAPNTVQGGRQSGWWPQGGQ
jgi:hypothetical protein